MGRKIPGRKHHGVRDPEKQQAQRLAKIKDKINAPPAHPDNQDIPKSLQRIIELKENVKKGLYKKKVKKPVPVDQEFQQKPGETDRVFLHRINMHCQLVQKEADFADKYGVDIKRNPETGEVKLVKRPKDELQVHINKLKKERKLKGKKKKKKNLDENGEDTPKLSKSQKWQLKKKEKLKKKLGKTDKDFGDLKDVVKFGEIAHAPPTLVKPKKAEQAPGAPRPGAKSSLLLKSMLPQPKPTIDKKGKRRDLPNALRRQLDTQQKEVIEAYKLLKAKKYAN